MLGRGLLGCPRCRSVSPLQTHPRAPQAPRLSHKKTRGNGCVRCSGACRGLTPAPAAGRAGTAHACAATPAFRRRSLRDRRPPPPLPLLFDAATPVYSLEHGAASFAALACDRPGAPPLSCANGSCRSTPRGWMPCYRRGADSCDLRGKLLAGGRHSMHICSAD